MNKRMTADVYTCRDCEQRLSQGEMERHSTSDCMKYFEALADKRLVLLKAANKDRVQQGSRCSHCKKLPKVISIWHGDYKFKDVHTDDCELAEAIAEE